jgi:hypothetical protein
VRSCLSFIGTAVAGTATTNRAKRVDTASFMLIKILFGLLVIVFLVGTVDKTGSLNRLNALYITVLLVLNGAHCLADRVSRGPGI